VKVRIHVLCEVHQNVYLNPVTNIVRLENFHFAHTYYIIIITIYYDC